MDAVRAERAGAERCRHRRVDPTRDADDDFAEAVLYDVVPKAECEREPHLLELRCERDDLRRDGVVVGRERLELDGRYLRRRFARTIQIASAHVAQPAADGVGRLDVDDEQVLLKAGCACDDLARRVEDNRVAVEHELILPADHVAERKIRARVARPGDQHLLALLGFSDVERRGREVHDELSSGESEIGRRRARLPEVLADRRSDVRVAEPEQHEIASLREVAVLVEHAVVREELLAVDSAYAPVGADGARVGQVSVEPRRADECHESGRGRSDLVEGLAGGTHEAGSKKEILRWIAGRGELWKHDDVCSGLPGLREGVEDLRAIPVEITDHCVQLAESDSQGFSLIVTNRV